MIPSKPTELRERAFADDTGVGIQDDNQLPRFGFILRQYCEASGALVNYDKCVGIRLGQARHTTPPINEVITPGKWYRMGIDKLKHKDKYLGIRLGTPDDIKESWTRLLGKVETECVQAMARSDPGATKGRLLWTRGVFAAK